MNLYDGNNNNNNMTAYEMVVDRRPPISRLAFTGFYLNNTFSGICHIVVGVSWPHRTGAGTLFPVDFYASVCLYIHFSHAI